jgi:hypothetical protein
MSETEPVPTPWVASGRYELLGELGAGGMATVHRALDTKTGLEIALKRLRARPNPFDHTRDIAHLEHEFHTLSQLAHPRVVSVLDYGVDGQDPYYTMELLDGGDLQERTPLAWKTACAFARDICSALSLLHSRRLVHRDLSPRNVRCTSDGRAKLIDFGAMVPMGPSKSVVGTPAVCAPELVRLQPLDGRTDLYALGATLYYTLTGRYPYPARTFGQLESMWKQPLPAPSVFAAGLPQALDALVLDLLQLDISLRPSSASEVMQRLGAIAGLALDEQLLVSQAYLTTPNLVGRAVPLARVRKYASGLLRERGRSILVDGVPGVGRSRFLDACILEGKLVGATVVRADASDAAAGEFGVALALGRRLLEAASDSAVDAALPHWDVLAQALPELNAHGAASLSPSAAASSDADTQLRQALQAWFLAVSRARPLMLVVDDAQLADEQSAALIALLAKDVQRHRLVIATSAAQDGSVRSPALRLLAEASVKLELLALTQPEIEKLLRSVFGDVPNVHLLASKLFAVSEGRPRDLMQLAQHLVDKGVLHYAAGAWSLPAFIDSADLPTNLADALVERVMALSPAARELAQAISLSGGQQLSQEECAQLTAQADTLHVLRCLDELLMANVVVRVADKYAMGPQAWSSALAGTLASEHAPALHARLARVFERRAHDGFLVAKHLFAAGADERGLDVLVAHAQSSQALTDADPNAFMKLLNMLPSGWLAVYDHALELCSKLGRPKGDAFALQRRVLGMAAYDSSARAEPRHYLAPFEQLSHDSGLDIYLTLDATLEPKLRLQRAFAMAQQRFDSLPELERVMAPRAAASALARVVLTCVSAVSTSLDLQLLQLLPSLEPLAPLSPAIAIVQMVTEGVKARLSGRTEDARLTYMALLDRLAAFDGGGLDETYRRTTELGIQFVMANLDAAMGLDSTLSWVELIASHPLHEVNAVHARGLHHLWRGDPQQADRLRAQAELLTVQRVRRTAFEGTHLVREVVAHAASDDLMRVKQSIDNIATMARRYPQWQPVLHYARGEHARILGDFPAALHELETALGLMTPGQHQIWPHTVAAHVQTLCALELYAEARSCGEAQLAIADAAGLGYVRNYIRMPLAIAQARNGELASAVQLAEAALADYVALGSQGLNRALAHETRAWVAVLAGDGPSAEAHLAQFAEHLSSGSSQTLTARYERVRRAAHKQFMGESAILDTPSINPLKQQIVAAMTACDCTEERALRSLDILLSETGSAQGFLFAVTGTSCTLAASRADHVLPAEIDAMARRSLSQELKDDASTGELEVDSTGGTQGWASRDGRTYRSVLLGHAGPTGFVVTGLGVLVLDSNQPFKYPTQIATEISRYAGLNYEAPRLSVSP